MASSLNTEGIKMDSALKEKDTYAFQKLPV